MTMMMMAVDEMAIMKMMMLLLLLAKDDHLPAAVVEHQCRWWGDDIDVHQYIQEESSRKLWRNENNQRWMMKDERASTRMSFGKAMMERQGR